MQIAAKSMMKGALCGLFLLTAAACTEHKEPVASVQDLLDDRVKLDGILLKCDKTPTLPDCGNARIAAARISSERDAQKAAQRDQDFERRREQLRLQQEHEKLSEQADKPDPYHLPVVPVDPPPGDSPTAPPPSTPPR